MTAVRIVGFTESHIDVLETLLKYRDAVVFREQRRAGELQAQFDAAQAQYLRMARYLDESRPGWRDEMKREITGGTDGQWAKQEGAE